MKNILLYFTIGLFATTTAFAQEGVVDQATIDDNGAYLSGYELNKTCTDTVYTQWNLKNANGINIPVGGFEVPLDMKDDNDKLLWQEGYKKGQYQISWDTDKEALRIDFENLLPNAGKNYMDFSLTWTHWLLSQNGESTPFDMDGDTLAGDIFSYGLDEDGNTNPVNIKIYAMTDVYLNLRVDLGDGNGRMSNALSPRNEVFVTDDFEEYSYSFSGTATEGGKDVNEVGVFADAFTEDWHGIKNGRGDKTLPPMYGKKETAPIMLDPQMISKISLIIDDDDKGMQGDVKTLWIKRIVLGDEEKIGDTYIAPWEEVCISCTDGVETLEPLPFERIDGGIKVAEEVSVYNIMGQLLSTGKDEVACPDGLVVIKGESGRVVTVFLD